MSSTLSTTQIESIPPRAIARLKMEEKPRLVRSSSIEKIRRFNSFICSQQYYILPALLSWLRSSQSGLQSSTEKTIFLFRSLLFNTFFYKIYLRGLRSAAPKAFRIRRRAESAFLNFRETLDHTAFLLALGVYTACALVILQLVVSVYLMCITFLPYGFIFLLACMVSINCLCYKTTRFFMAQGNRRRCCK